jgi:hypothetical protein
MENQSQRFQTEQLEQSLQHKIDKEVSRFTTNIRKDRSSDQTKTALGLAILAVAAVQTDNSKAKKLLDLLRDLGL